MSEEQAIYTTSETINITASPEMRAVLAGALGQDAGPDEPEAEAPADSEFCAQPEPAPRNPFADSQALPAVMGQHADELYESLRMKANLQGELEVHLWNMESIRATVTLSDRIDGKNAESRLAQMIIALREHEAYLRLEARVMELRVDIAKADAEIEYYRVLCSGNRAKARMYAAQLEYLAEAR